MNESTACSSLACFGENYIPLSAHANRVANAVFMFNMLFLVSDFLFGAPYTLLNNLWDCGCRGVLVGRSLRLDFSSYLIIFGNSIFWAGMAGILIFGDLFWIFALTCFTCYKTVSLSKRVSPRNLFLDAHGIAWYDLLICHENYIIPT